ncbi:hypothetical protein BHE74_00051005 [Ensete ventricosum]|nr:hypothetical protein BHE74_00051005 [Ensete ventricosum]
MGSPKPINAGAQPPPPPARFAVARWQSTFLPQSGPFGVAILVSRGTRCCAPIDHGLHLWLERGAGARGGAMRRSKLESPIPVSRKRFVQFLLVVGFLYLSFLLLCELPFVSRRFVPGAGGLIGSDVVARRVALDSEEESQGKYAPVRPFIFPYRQARSSPAPFQQRPPPDRRDRRLPALSGLALMELNASGSGAFSELHKSARDAWEVGKKYFEELQASPAPSAAAPLQESRTEERCPNSIMLSGAQFQERGRVLVLPCGLTLGSHITLVARPRRAHAEYDPKISSLNEGDQAIMVSQFMMELQGLKTVDGEDPPRILHFNPRLKGDWSGKPVIEENTCYRMQWGSPQRCEGWKSKADEETGIFSSILGFVLEDATGLSLNGDLDIDSIYAASLPSTHPSFAPQRHLELSARWQAPPFTGEPVELFIGILSAGNHFAERMAVRKSWMSAEWPEEDYPPYANGPGYVVSVDIAHFVISEFEKHTLRVRSINLCLNASFLGLFKMEDVSMGMWIESFNNTKPVEYVHNLKFCQFGCINDYYTAHYQSPRQMMCMWEKLQAGKPHCCNMR